jgi:hypothetical protein
VRRRTGRPGLLGSVARTAVIAGTATMTTNAVQGAESRRQTSSNQPAAERPGDDLIDKLARLAQLRDGGALSGAEFEAAKAKLLG